MRNQGGELPRILPDEGTVAVQLSTRPQTGTGGDRWDSDDDRLSNRWVSTRGSEAPGQPRDGLQRRSDGSEVINLIQQTVFVGWRYEVLEPSKSSEGYWERLRQRTL